MIFLEVIFFSRIFHTEILDSQICSISHVFGSVSPTNLAKMITNQNLFKQKLMHVLTNVSKIEKKHKINTVDPL